MSGLGAPPSVPYWHLFTDGDGVSRQELRHLTDYEAARIGEAAPQWNNEQAPDPQKIVFTVQPVGWVGEWHDNPAPQWIVVLSGRWFIEAMDGTRIEQGPGEFSLGADQGCVAIDGRKGHRSGTVGDQPCALMCVRLAQPLAG